MRNSHARLLLLFLLASLLAPGCAPRKPANFRDLVPQSPEQLNEMAKESEWTILVTVDAERRVFFRKEQVGTTEDVGTLKERVRQVIESNRQKARELSGKEPDNTVSTVFLKAPDGMTYGEVSKVVDALKEAGGNPIGLQPYDAPR
ncbi:MAG TPA: biopolymer transporter ExbD [Pyrinomonadaceae bacterium]